MKKLSKSTGIANVDKKINNISTDTNIADVNRRINNSATYISIIDTNKKTDNLGLGIDTANKVKKPMTQAQTHYKKVDKLDIRTKQQVILANIGNSDGNSNTRQPKFISFFNNKLNHFK